MNLFTAIVQKEDNLYVAQCPEVGTASQGETIEEAIKKPPGSHVVLRKDDKGCVIPKHKALAAGMLKNAMRQAGVTAEEFFAAYKGK